MTLPADVREYPQAIAEGLSRLRLVGVNGPYAVLLGADAYTALAETSDHGYPVLEHVKRLVNDKIIWAPAIEGAFVLTTRGGDFDLHIGQDASIGYLSHTDTTVRICTCRNRLPSCCSLTKLPLHWLPQRRRSWQPFTNSGIFTARMAAVALSIRIAGLAFPARRGA